VKCFGGTRSVRGSILAVESVLAVLGVLEGMFWRIEECSGECFGRFRSVR